MKYLIRGRGDSFEKIINTKKYISFASGIEITWINYTKGIITITLSLDKIPKFSKRDNYIWVE